MPMKEIAAKIEKKQLLDMLDILEKLNGEGREVVSKEEMMDGEKRMLLLNRGS